MSGAQNPQIKSLAQDVAELQRRVNASTTSDRKKRRAALIASHELPAALAKSLATEKLETVERVVAGFPKRGAVTSEQRDAKRELDRRMGMPTSGPLMQFDPVIRRNRPISVTKQDRKILLWLDAEEHGTYEKFMKEPNAAKRDAIFASARTRYWQTHTREG